jgi:hypothetical protein
MLLLMRVPRHVCFSGSLVSMIPHINTVRLAKMTDLILVAKSSQQRQLQD